MNPDYKQVGRRIREERLAAGISQADLAELVDVSPQYISLVEMAGSSSALRYSFALRMCSLPRWTGCFSGIRRVLATRRTNRSVVCCQDAPVMKGE